MRVRYFTSALAWLSFMVGYSAAATKCYFPDGRSSDSNYVPCLPNNGASFCCHINDYCTKNGLCLSVLNGYHYRGGCTDPSWLSSSCPTACLGDQNSGNSSWVNIIACNAAQAGGSWCCAYEGNCCSSSTFLPNWGTLFTASPVAATAGSVTNGASPGASKETAPSSTSSPSVCLSSVPAVIEQSGSACASPSATIAVGVVFGVLWAVATSAAVAFFVRGRTNRLAAASNGTPPDCREIYTNSTVPESHPACELDTRHHKSELP